MLRRPPRSTPLYSSAASDVYKRQGEGCARISSGAVPWHVCLQQRHQGAQSLARRWPYWQWDNRDAWELGRKGPGRVRGVFPGGDDVYAKHSQKRSTQMSKKIKPSALILRDGPANELRRHMVETSPAQVYEPVHILSLIHISEPTRQAESSYAV